jgi:hypothetical protein
MPAGKLGAIASAVWVKPLSHGISVRSLKCFRSARKVKKKPDAAAIRQRRKRLRNAFRRYLVDCSQVHPTATELRKSVSAIVKAAQRFVASPTWKLADDLLTRLEINRNVETVIRQGLRISGAEWVLLKREMRRQLAVGVVPGESPAAVAERSVRIAGLVLLMARFDVAMVAPESGRWADPALFRLVSVLAPLWKEVTGRAAGPLSDNWGKEGRQFLFADWLEEMHCLIGFEAPLRGRILDSVRPSGPRRRQKKPPSVKRQKA